MNRPTDDGTCSRFYEPPIKGGQGRESHEICTYGARIAWCGIALLAAVAASVAWILWGVL